MRKIKLDNYWNDGEQFLQLKYTSKHSLKNKGDLS